MTGYSLNIADYTILFNVMTDGINLCPSPSQKSFITSDKKFDLAVNVFVGPVVIKEEASAVFRAPYVEEISGISIKKSDEFWTVYRLGEYILIRTTCPRSNVYREALLVIRPGEKSWDIIIDTSASVIDPINYPVDGLLLYYLTALNNDIFIHGSGVKHRGRGYLFSGSSGKGKTTIAGLFKNIGAEIIHDDRLILRQRNNKIYMYNTPVYPYDKYKKAELSLVYLIDHGNINYSSHIGHSEAVATIMSNCIQHHWDTGMIGNLTGAILKLVNMVKVKTLQFVPDSTVVSFIEKNGR
ncbi:MAG TPA: hypothetical protein DEQ09_09920 [Bacteroidales bacterium]|nr:hypothetical protein [Bacteroidales bacterium]